MSTVLVSYTNGRLVVLKMWFPLHILSLLCGAKYPEFNPDVLLDNHDSALVQ